MHVHVAGEGGREGSERCSQEDGAGDGNDEDALDAWLQLPQHGLDGRVLAVHRDDEAVRPHEEALHRQRGVMC